MNILGLMNQKLLFSTAVVLLLVAAPLPSDAARNYIKLFGEPGQPAAATRTVVIHPETRYVNVEGGQTIKFVAGGKEFAWNFNVGRTIGVFDLNQVAPAGVLDHLVRVYITPDPRYNSP
jgi:hypothetical protein